jgi:hypothetical protein
MQNIPTPPTAPTAPPTQGGQSSGQPLTPTEVAFLGGILGPVLETVGPLALNWLRDRVSSMGTAAADEAAVQEVAEETRVAFLNFLVPFIPSIIELGSRLISGASIGQAAGGADAQSGGTAGGQGAGTAGAAPYVR